MYSRHELTEHARSLGIVPGDTVMVHASVRSVGEVAGGPDEIHLALKDALTPAGTLMMYASCPQYVDDVGRGNLTPEQEREVLEKLPAFDPLTARSARDNGALVEFLRTYPGTLATPHVARFVAWGKHAVDLTREPPWSYSFGRGSALEGLVALNGKILLLGSDLDQVTFLHYAEHIADFPNKRIARFKVPVLEDRKRVWRDMEEVDSSKGAHRNWPDRFFAVLVEGHLHATHNTGGRFGDSKSYVIRARALLDYAMPSMIDTARNGWRGADLSAG